MPAVPLLSRLRSPSGIVELVLRLILGGTFLYAGIVKAQQPVGFLEDIRSFHLVPDPYAAWLAMGLPWLEILAGAAVITGVLYSGGLFVLAMALLVFLGALFSAVSRGIDITCGCFGKSEDPSIYSEIILRDVALLAAAAWLMISHGRRVRKPSVTPQAP